MIETFFLVVGSTIFIVILAIVVVAVICELCGVG